jgi:hypothetical protein
MALYIIKLVLMHQNTIVIDDPFIPQTSSLIFKYLLTSSLSSIISSFKKGRMIYLAIAHFTIAFRRVFDFILSRSFLLGIRGKSGGWLVCWRLAGLKIGDQLFFLN